jgi:hypothetical protein
MAAAALVIAIWTAVTIARALEISPAWTPLFLGLELAAFGTVRRLSGGRCGRA